MKKIETCLICGKKLTLRSSDNLICAEHVLSLEEPQKAKVVSQMQQFRVDFNYANRCQVGFLAIFILYCIILVLFTINTNTLPFNPYYLLIGIPIGIFLEYCFVSNRKTVLLEYSNWIRSEFALPEQKM